MKAFAKNLAKALHDLLTSKKFLAGLFTFLVQALPVSGDLKQHALEVGLVYIGAQGVADFGKGKAEVQAQAPATSAG